MRRPPEERGFVGFGAPAGPVRDHEVPGLDGRLPDEDFLVPRNPVHIDLHHPQVGRRGREMRVHHRGQVAVEVVRSDIDFVGVRAGGDLHRLPDSVPDGVDDGDVHGFALEVGHEAAETDQGLAGTDRMTALLADKRERARIAAVDLDPEEVELAQGAQDFQEALRRAVEIQV